MKSLKIFSVAGLLLGLMMTTATAGGPELKPYGFVKGDMVFASRGVDSFGGANSLSAPMVVCQDDSTAKRGYTGQHTRFGLKGTTGDEDGLTVGGRIELDFFNNGGFETNNNPRMRLAYASIAGDAWELRIGQQWDLFSPLNATTNNTNGNLWHAGNRGFRRAQIQGRFDIPMDGMALKAQVSVGEARLGAVTGASGLDNQAMLPMVQGRAAVQVEKGTEIGGHFVFAQYEPNPHDIAGGGDSYNTVGFGGDVTLALMDGQLKFKGEANYGKNLNNAALFAIAGSAGGGTDDERKSLGFWGNVTFKASDMLTLVAGGGMDKNNTDNLTTGTTDQNMVVYGDVVVTPGSGFSLALEGGIINTSWEGQDSETAVLIDLAGKVGF